MPRLEISQALKQFLQSYENGDVYDALTLLDTPFTLVVALAEAGKRCPDMRLVIDEAGRKILVRGLYLGHDRDDVIGVLTALGMKPVDRLAAWATVDDRWYFELPPPRLPAAM